MDSVDPGWYPDPTGDERLRWWDGAGWTERTRVEAGTEGSASPAPSGTEPVPPAAPPSQQAIDAAVAKDDAARSRKAAIALAVLAVVGLGGAAGALAVTGLRADDDATEPEGPDAAEEVADESRERDPEEDAEAAEAEAEPPDDPATDISDTDWSAQTWTTGCGTAAGSIEVTLTPSSSTEGGDHAAEGQATDSGVYSYAVDIAGVLYGDVTGDGQDEAVFTATCVPGNFVIETLEVWRRDDEGEVVQAPSPTQFDRGTGLLDEIEVVDDALRITSLEPRSDDPQPWLHDGYVIEVVQDWRLDGDRWHLTEVSRQDPPATGPQAGHEDWDDHIVDGFVTPSGNIHCVATTYWDGIECEIGTFLDPPPGECEGVWSGAEMLPTGSAAPTCATDSVLGETWPEDLPELGYGSSWTHGDISCESESTGLTCENATGGGFLLSRESWSAW